MKGILLSLAIHLVVLTITFGQKQLNTLKSQEREASQVFSVVLKVDEEQIQKIKKKISKVTKKVKPKKVVKKVIPKPVKKVSTVTKTKQKKNNGKLKNIYLSELRQFIESKKYYPRMAARLKHVGVVEIALTLDEEGNFKDIHIKKPSSFDTLNKAALDLIKSLKKFKPIPQDMSQTIAVYIPLHYHL
jgi:protein TonB